MDPTGDRSRYRDDGISNAGRLLDSASVEPAQVPHDPNQIASVVAGRSDSVATMGKDGAKGRHGTHGARFGGEEMPSGLIVDSKQRALGRNLPRVVTPTWSHVSPVPHVNISSLTDEKNAESRLRVSCSSTEDSESAGSSKNAKPGRKRKRRKPVKWAHLSEAIDFGTKLDTRSQFDKFVEGDMSVKKYIRLRKAVIVIQRRWRRWRELLEQRRVWRNATREWAAICIQRFYRRKKIDKMIRICCKLLFLARREARLQREQEERLRWRAALRIQKQWRKRWATRKLKELRQQEEIIPPPPEFADPTDDTPQSRDHLLEEVAMVRTPTVKEFDLESVVESRTGRLGQLTRAIYATPAVRMRGLEKSDATADNLDGLSRLFRETSVKVGPRSPEQQRVYRKQKRSQNWKENHRVKMVDQPLWGEVDYFQRGRPPEWVGQVSVSLWRHRQW